MKIRKVRLFETPSFDGDVIVVIDVLRAFTTAAYAFHQGADQIFMIADPKEAFAIQKKIPGALLIGESQGILLPDFHFGNSPTEMAKNCLKGKTLVQRTSCGTQGVVKSRHLPRILTASFVVAEATVNKIRELSPKKLTLMITGTKNGDEDAALADYIEKKLLCDNVDPSPYIERVRSSPSGRAFASEKFPHFPVTDLEAACSIDKFSFAMEVFKKEDLLILKPSI